MPALPTTEDIERAQRLLRPRLPVTRLIEATLPELAAPLWLKLESELPTGSFKVRGALYALLVAQERGDIAEVVAASTGNHGAAVAFAARELGVTATIFLPAHPNTTKRARIVEHGARVVEGGVDIAAARAAAEQYVRESGAYLLDDATDPRVPAGPATIGVEILEQHPSVRTIIVPMGDTALIRGVAAAAKAAPHEIRIIGVQAATAPAYANAWRTGVAEATPDCITIADGLATRVPDAANVAAIRQVVDDVVLVTDAALEHAVRVLLGHEGIIAEPSGAASVAAALQLRDVGADAVALITGSNTATTVDLPLAH